jgi:hypothetical protein
MMKLFDLFHGEEAHQRNDLFDQVAETVLTMVIGHQRSTEDNKSFVDLLTEALGFASGAHIRERIIKNISIGEGNLAGEILQPFFERLREIDDALGSPAQKLARIRTELISKMTQLEQSLGAHLETYQKFGDSLAIVLRDVSVEAHNQSRDYGTARSAIQEAQRLASSAELRIRIRDDMKALQESEDSYKCAVCNQAKPDPSCALQMDLNLLPPEIRAQVTPEDRRKGYVELPRCRSCMVSQSQTQKAGGSGCLILILIPAVSGVSMLLHILGAYS